MVLPIVTARLEIRDFVPEDRPALHEYASDPRVTQYLWWGPFTETDTLQFLERTGRDAKACPRANTASRQLLARIGFRLEGHLRKDALIRGEWRDSLVYALLADEWPSDGS